MLVRVPALLPPQEFAWFRDTLAGADWVDGKATAGTQSAEVKRNLQLAETSPTARVLGERILSVLGRNELFNSASLALRVFPPLFNRYDSGMGFGAHIDNAIRFVSASIGTGAPIRVRTDLSATLFLTDPADYDGGELVILDGYGEQRVKLAALEVHSVSAMARAFSTPVKPAARRQAHRRTSAEQRTTATPAAGTRASGPGRASGGRPSTRPRRSPRPPS